jgi:DNA-binding transcriptional LysR family regulator
VEEKRLQVVNVHRDEIRLIVPAGHVLARKQSVECRDIVGMPLLLPKQGITRTRLNSWLESVEEEIHVSMELDSTEMMKRFVMAGLGISFLTISNCREEVAAGRVATVPLAPEPLVRRLGLVYRKDKALSKAALGFIEVTLEKMSDGNRLETARPKASAG